MNALFAIVVNMNFYKGIVHHIDVYPYFTISLHIFYLADVVENVMSKSAAIIT